MANQLTIQDPLLGQLPAEVQEQVKDINIDFIPALAQLAAAYTLWGRVIPASRVFC
jgi:hypothetical protein